MTDSHQIERTVLDCVLAKFPDTSRRQAKEWILAGRVQIGGQVVRRPHETVKDAGTVELFSKASVPHVLTTPWRIHPRVTLLYLDGALAVVDKGAGLLSVPSPRKELSAESILRDFLCGQLHPLQRGEAAQESVRHQWRLLTPLRVHRLDQYTSGLLCFAMNPEARAFLIEKISNHQVKREYVAFVEGQLKTKQGTWRHWLASRDGEMRQRVLTTVEAKREGSDAVEAVTHFEVAAEFPFGGRTISKLRLQLETGRTHQIRAQAEEVGAPVMGDSLYGRMGERESGGMGNGRETKRDGKGRENIEHSTSNIQRSMVLIDRQALHAARLALEHPVTHRQMEWVSPLAKDLRVLEAALRRKKPSVAK